MPMPALDPARFVPVVLSDTTHKLPMPDRGGRFFSQDLASPETVDIFDPFYASLLADGSIRRACPVATAAAVEAKDAEVKAAEEAERAKAAEKAAESRPAATPAAEAEHTAA